MAEIAVLSELVQSRIAAGEVIERPASAVKELVENALDAGASRIDVEIELGGRRRIRVSDDGRGMTQEDLAASVERFATSKLRSERDLAGIMTMGFRGEALPSMASVAELEITTRRPDSDEAWRLRSEPDGTRVGPEPAAAAPGTTVELRSLFARTPARLKFLKADATETGAVAEAIERLALARPGIGFRLKADGRETLSAPPGQTIASRAAQVLGSTVASGMTSVSAGDEGWLGIDGLVTAPGGPTRRDRGWQFVSLNGRPVRDRMLAHAASSAFESVIPHGRHPIIALNLSIDPAQVDVNVHPAKHEVRFRSSGAVHEFVRRSIREALRGAGAELVGRVAAPVLSPAEPTAPARSYDLWRPSGNASGGASVVARGGSFVGESVGESANTEPPESSGYRLIGRTRAGMLLVETERDLRIIDPHALHERVLYERLSMGEVSSQSLLVPETVELSASEAAALGKAAEALAALGFAAEQFGGRTAVVRAVPSGVPSSVAGEVLREVLSDVASGGAGASSEPVERLRRSIACRAAVKLGSRVEPSELAALMADSEGVPMSCPHGRPVAWTIPHGEIARRLGRA